MALSELGTALFDFLRRAGARFRAHGRRGESEESLPGLLRALEERRPGYPYPRGSQERLRGTTLAYTPWHPFLRSFLTAALILGSVARTRTANRGVMLPISHLA